MTLQSSGAISMDNIQVEMGLSPGATSNMATHAAAHLPSALSAPHSMSEWYSYNHNPVTWGRCYGSDNVASFAVWIKRITQGSAYQCNASINLEFTGDRNEYCDTRRTSTATWQSLHNVDLDWYKRTKQTSGSWGAANWTEIYTSEDKYCNFSVYDYWFDTYDNEGGCLTGENNIYISPNIVKNVKDIKVGDKVYTAPADDYTKLGYYKVFKMERVMQDRIATVTFDTGYKIRCSTSHKFMTISDVGEVAGNKLYMLEPGADVLSVVDTEFKRNRIVSIDFSDKPEYVYKIEVEDAHTYFTEDNFYHHNEK